MDFQNKLIGGVGLYWADFPILSHNQLLLKTSRNKQELFAMLEHSEIDYFARGVNEIFIEKNWYLEQNWQFEISSEVALFYPFSVYFYVRSDRPELARRIYQGLNKAEANGSFKKLFKSYFKREIEGLHTLNPRRVIFLDNPYWTEDPPVNYEWWFGGELERPVASKTNVPMD